VTNITYHQREPRIIIMRTLAALFRIAPDLAIDNARIISLRTLNQRIVAYHRTWRGVASKPTWYRHYQIRRNIVTNDGGSSIAMT